MVTKIGLVYCKISDLFVQAAPDVLTENKNSKIEFRCNLSKNVFKLTFTMLNGIVSDR